MKYKVVYFFFLFAFIPLTSFAKQDSLTNSVASIKVGYKNSPPFVYQNQAGELDGISVFLIEELAREMGLKVEYKAYELDELIQAVEAAEVDLSINPLTVTAERLERMDFSQPFAISKLAVVMKNENDSQLWLILSNLFSFNFLKAVLLLLLVILIFGLIIWVFERKKNPHFEKGASGLFSGLWFSAVTMTTVGYGDKAPVTTAGKITTLIWMFNALIIISGFTASIAASLTVGQLGSGVNSMADLRKLKIGTIQNSSSESFLIKKQMNLQSFPGVQDGLRAVSEGQVEAFVYDEPLIRFRLQEGANFKNLQVIPFTFKRQYYSLGFPKNSFWLEQLNPRLISLIGNNRWQEKVQQYGLVE